MFTGFFFDDFVLDPTFVFEIVIAMEQILTAELSDIFTASGRM